jgi:hypothetical protein
MILKDYSKVKPESESITTSDNTKENVVQEKDAEDSGKIIVY